MASNKDVKIVIVTGALSVNDTLALCRLRDDITTVIITEEVEHPAEDITLREPLPFRLKNVFGETYIPFIENKRPGRGKKAFNKKRW